MPVVAKPRAAVLLLIRRPGTVPLYGGFVVIPISTIFAALVLFLSPGPTPNPTPMGGDCGPTTVAPEGVPHSEMGEVSK